MRCDKPALLPHCMPTHLPRLGSWKTLMPERPSWMLLWACQSCFICLMSLPFRLIEFTTRPVRPRDVRVPARGALQIAPHPSASPPPGHPQQGHQHLGGYQHAACIQITSPFPIHRSGSAPCSAWRSAGPGSRSEQPPSGSGCPRWQLLAPRDGWGVQGSAVSS